MEFETQTYQLTTTQPLLGSSSNNPDVQLEHLIKKGTLDEGKRAEEYAAIARVRAEKNLQEDPEEVLKHELDKGITVFPRDPDTGNFIAWDYVLRGFLKESMFTLLETGDKVLVKTGASKWSIRSAIDSTVFVTTRRIPLMRDGKAIDKPDRLFTRPIRVNTQQGPRVGLVTSEELYPGVTLEFSVAKLVNQISPQAKSQSKLCVSFDAIYAALTYGYCKGLWQWRSGAYGSFRWKAVTEVKELSVKTMEEMEQMFHPPVK